MPTAHDLIFSFVDRIADWIVEEPGGEVRMRDPYEEEYGENYAPACCAYLTAWALRRRKHPLDAQQATRLLDRCVDLLDRREGHRFTRAFIHFFSLMALREWEIGTSVPGSDRWRSILRAIEIRPRGDEPLINANHAALSAGIHVLSHLLELPNADLTVAAENIDRIAQQQLPSGFINDTFEQPLMPIAYHIFTLALLSITAASLRQSADGNVGGLLRQIDALLQPGFHWLHSAIAPDGSIAMTQRSRYQLFTWGASVLALTYAGVSRTSPLLQRIYEWWFPYLRGDGTVQVTPNQFSPYLRVGYESYSRFGMYNSLCFALMAAAEWIRETAAAIDSGLSSETAEGAFADLHSGVLFLRRKRGFAAVCLRAQEKSPFGVYALAGQPFHLVLGGGRHAPLASPKLLPNHIEGSAYEGLLFRVADHWEVPKLELQGDPLHQGDAVVLRYGSKWLDCTKRFGLDSDRFQIRQEITLAVDCDRVDYAFPIVLTDGAVEAQLHFDGPRVQYSFGPERYLLTHDGRTAWQMGPERGWQSANGVSGLLRVALAESQTNSGDRIISNIEIRRIR